MEQYPWGIKASVWNVGGIPLSRVEYSNHRFAPHFHNHWVIMNVRSGINLGHKDRLAYAVDKSNLLILEPGVVHTGSSWGGRRLVYDAIYPDVSALDSVAARLEIPLKSDFNAHVVTNPQLILSFNELFRSVAEGKDSLEHETAMCDFLSTLARETEGASSLPEIKKECAVVKRVERFIADHYTDNGITLQQISQAAQVSPFYLIRVFKRSCGQTPFEFLRNYRVERSKELMRSGDSLTEIAFAAGFYDQSHFIRSFRAVTGWSPGLYRKAIR